MQDGTLRNTLHVQDFAQGRGIAVSPHPYSLGRADRHEGDTIPP